MSRRATRPPKRFADMVDNGYYYGEEEEEITTPKPARKRRVVKDEEEEGEPAPPEYYFASYEGSFNRIPFKYKVGEKNVHLDTRNGNFSTFGRDDCMIFIPDVYYMGDLVLVLKMLEKRLEYYVDGRFYQIQIQERPTSLHIQGRDELPQKRSLIMDSLYGTLQWSEEVGYDFKFYREASKTDCFLHFTMKKM